MDAELDDIPGGYSWDAVVARLAAIRDLGRQKRELSASLRDHRSSLRQRYREAEQARRKLNRLRSYPWRASDGAS